MRMLFVIEDNTDVVELPEEFGDLSFRKITIERTAMNNVHPSAILPSKHLLTELFILDSRLDDFPFDILHEFQFLKQLHLSNNLLALVPAFKSDNLERLRLDNNKITIAELDGWETPKLRELYLERNLLTTVRAFKSDNLEILYLYNNEITSVEADGWATPNLREFDIDNNPLMKFPSTIIKCMKKLEEFYCSRCNLGPTLSGGLLEFQSSALKLVHLSENNVTSLEPGAIIGLGSNTRVDLSENKIAVLSEESFRPMLDILYLGDGVIDLSGNPILCDCEVAWLLLGRKFQRKIPGKCHNGTEFKDLDSNSMRDCPRECRYRCIKSLWLSLCTPGTVTVSHVGNCQSGELCCQPNVPKTTTVTPAPVPAVSIVCGRKEYQVTLSTGGKPSDMGEWPWQVAIYDAQKEDVICGGALIQEQWVLTAAHCVVMAGSFKARDAVDISVYLGKHYRANVKDDEYVQIRRVSHIILQKDFKIDYYDSDIALLKLTEPALLTARVQLVCLPTRLDISEENLENGMQGWFLWHDFFFNSTMMQVAGWGHDGSDILTTVLTEVQLPVLSNRLCRQDTINLTGNLTAVRTLTSNMFCAGHSMGTPLKDYRTVCPGNEGSPMVFLSNVSLDSYWTVEGIVSHIFQRRGQTCSMRRPGQYAVFTKVNRGLESMMRNRATHFVSGL
ncbi:unnamed protein product [Darwinula stevensoni]|uniref:Peptidase S1 domain-containing protein n=1 Tax=Darwinula stevensoni TaxID=69355 RepID=A0A7R8XC04_9CRUS|nr:unnamed protein product [Darwinula stevensoni]CAG0887202.1 unnamed protein product [Darwinula stevensoni]